VANIGAARLLKVNQASKTSEDLRLIIIVRERKLSDFNKIFKGCVSENRICLERNLVIFQSTQFTILK